MSGRTDNKRRFTPTRRQVLACGAAAAGVSTFGIIGRAKAATGRVVFYTTMPTNYANKMVDAFHASNKDGIKLEIFFSSGFTLYERAFAEYTAGRIGHDLIMLTDPSLFLILKRDKRLLDYISPQLAAYPASQKDPDGLWCNGRTVLTIFSYNTRIVPDGARYKSWNDFVNPAFANGRIGISNALESGTTLQHFYNVANHPALGKKWWRELAALKPMIASGPSPLTRTNISGQTPLVLNNDYNAYEEKTKNGAPIAAVYPSELVSASIIPMGIVRGGPNPEAAKVVYDWWLSKEGQTILQEVNSIYSPRNDVTPLPGLPKFADLPIVVAPTEELDRHRDDLQKEFREVFGL
jgi:iron(III) transport system substrate-binding protein